MVSKPLIWFGENNGKNKEYIEIKQQQHDDINSTKNSWISWNPIYGSLTIRHHDDEKPTKSAAAVSSTSNSRRFFQFGWMGLFVFLFALASSLYAVWLWHEYHQESMKLNNNQFYEKELKLVSLFNRHGDRAPSDQLPDVDKHKYAINFFWPNGLHNLTDFGKIRTYKLGMELRHMYDGYIGYDHQHVLAFSSELNRCIESLEGTLKGFYELEGPKDRGLAIVRQWRNSPNCTECLPDGLGSPEEWKLIKIDSESIRTLTSRETERCRYSREHPSALDENLMVHGKIRALPGIKRLERLMIERYSFKGLQTGRADGIFSTVKSELNLVRTRESIVYTDHYSDWIDEVVATTADGNFNITLYDILEQATVYRYRDDALGIAKWLEIGPILTSLIESQSVALNDQNMMIDAPTMSKMGKSGLYQDKRIIFYSSHDSILQRILHHLELIDFQDDELTYEQRFANWKTRGGDDFDKLLSGLSMSSYGLSIKFELWKTQKILHNSGSGFSHVQVSLYNEEEFRFGGIVYRPLKLGDACVRLFKKKHTGLTIESLRHELDRFYHHDLPIDWSFGCPFELFKNVTADLMVDEQKFSELC